MKELSKESFSNCCYDPFSGEVLYQDARSNPGIYFAEDWHGTAADVLRNTVCPAYDRLISFVLETDWVTKTEKTAVVELCHGIIADHKDQQITKILPFQTSIMLAARFQGRDELCEMLADVLEAA